MITRGPKNMFYKLTDSNGCTHGGSQWGPGVRHEATGTGTELCSDGYIHFYDHPLLAVIMNPMQGNFSPKSMRMWECEVEGEIVTGKGLKFGAKAVTTTREIPVPVITLNQTLDFVDLCASAGHFKMGKKYKILEKDYPQFIFNHVALFARRGSTEDFKLLAERACSYTKDSEDIPSQQLLCKH